MIQAGRLVKPKLAKRLRRGLNDPMSGSGPQEDAPLVEGIDHLVLTVRDLERSAEFYRRVLGMTVAQRRPGGLSLHFGRQKLNLHQHDAEIHPRAERPTPGAADFCLLAARPLEEVAAHLERQGVELVAGPVARQGACGPMSSVYFRDPDGNLIEVARYQEKP